MIATQRLLTAIVLCALATGCKPADDDRDFRALWQADNAQGERIDHALWQAVLDHYLIAEDDALNRVDYAGLQRNGMAQLRRYLGAMAAIDPRAHSRDEQMAYWINLYNALTLRVIADAWPVASILKVGSGSVFGGPWDDPVITINNQALTLNDIEHRILRGIWQEPRIHFAVNCASVGCPDLQPAAFNGQNLEALLALSARQYLASERGVKLDEDTLVLSSLFDWYAADFGDDAEAVRARLATYADTATAVVLREHDGKVRYDYDWALNGLPGTRVSE